MTLVSGDKLISARAIGEEIKAALEASRLPENSGRDVLELAPVSFQSRLAEFNVSKLSAEIAQELEKKKSGEPLLGSMFGCSVCTTLTYAGIVALLGASVIVSGGMSIPAVLAASGYSMAGLATVISAMTGVSAGAVSALLSVAGASLGLVVIGLCEAMGCC